MNITVTENLKKILNKKIILVSLPVTLLAFSLTGCGNQNTQEVSSVNEQELISQVENNSSLDELESYLEDKTSSGNVIESAISIMSDLFQKLGKAGSEAFNDENTQVALNKAFEEFDTLLGFLFNNEEVAGVRFSDVSDVTKEKIRNWIFKFDEKLNEWVPDYKERFKEWCIKTGADGYNLLINAKEGFNDFRDEIINEYSQTYAEENEKTYTKL